MTPEELRIRCAEIEGWKDIQNINGCIVGMKPCSNWIYPANLPDYCNSIDAINAAVLRLSDEKLEAWEYALEEELFGMMNQALRDDPGHRAALATASAIERATAFAAIHSK